MQRIFRTGGAGAFVMVSLLAGTAIPQTALAQDDITIRMWALTGPGHE